MKRILSLLIVCLISFSSTVRADDFRIIDDENYHIMLNYLLVSRNDVRLYKRIFRAINDAEFKKADNLILRLDNHILLGNVLAEKYLHPKYKSRFSELYLWMVKYRDYSQAGKIYKLAQKKAAQDKVKTAIPLPIVYADKVSYKEYDKNTKIYLNRQTRLFRKYLNQGKTKKARLVLEQPKFRKLILNSQWDELAGDLALKYFIDGYDDLAWFWGTKSARRKTSTVGPWAAGLSAWRQKKYKNSAIYFSRLAQLKDADEWLVSAGAFWAYRSYNQLKNPQKAKQMLELAKNYKHTFYGILASHQLGEIPRYNWQNQTYFNNFSNSDYVYDLLGSPYIRRAVVLRHAGQNKLAEQELQHGYNNMNAKQKEAVVFVANQYQFYHFGIIIADKSKNLQKGYSYDQVAYPLPEWFPNSGWTADKSLILGLIRQESSFRPQAESHVGAQGLMQIMPRTAYHISKNASLKYHKNHLKDINYNLKLGQKYVNYLLNKPFIEGNLFYFLTAYNAGPTNLLRWKKSMNYKNDPLLFIETIPSAQTRIYIERVMANFWIYNARFAQPNHSIDELLNNRWPHINKLADSSETAD